jgi:uncharacterized membrane protein YeaQ/YmgE (transglycosylase-associated protein family)
MTADTVVQMGPMLILAGLTAAWMAETVSRASGYGFMWDLALALTGSILAGTAVWAALASPAGMPTMFVVGCVGAALLIVVQRSLWRGPGVRA